MTTAWHPAPAPGFRLALLVIRSAAWLVPEYRRDEWREEWEAEVWYHLLALRDRNDLGLLQQWRLLRRCAGAYRHALWVLGREFCRPGFGAALLGAARSLRGAPLRHATAIAGAGLALGVAALAFGAAERWRAQPAPFPGGPRTVRLFNTAPAADIDRTGFSRFELAYLRQQSRSLEVLAAFRRSPIRMTSAGTSREVAAARVTPDWFRAVGIEEREPTGWFGGPEPDRPVAVVREDLWAGPARMGAYPRVVTLDGVPHAVVGVLPAGFAYPDPDTKVWVPLHLDALGPHVGDRSVALIGRLRAGVDAGAAEDELRRLTLEMQAAHPEGYFAAYGVPWSIEVVANRGVPSEQLPLVVLLFVGAAALVVGSGIGVGMLSRPSGVGLERILGGAVLVGGAAAVGCVVLAVGHLWMTRSIGAGVALESGGTTLETVVFLGAAAIAAAGLTVIGRRAGRSPGTVAASVACAVLVVTVAAALGRVYALRLQPVDVADGLVALSTRGRALDQSILPRVHEIRGVRTAALTSSIPGIGNTRRVTLETESGPSSANPAPGVEIVTVTRGYFHVVGLRLLAGRDLLPSTSPGAAAKDEVVVNRELAARFWPRGGAVGQRVIVQLASSPSPWLTIVGVVDDGRRLPQGARPVAAVYLPPRPGAEPLSALVVRGELPPADIVAALRRDRAAPSGTFGDPIDVNAAIRASAAPYRVGRGLLGLLALAATLLAMMTLVAVSGRAAWRGLGVGVAGGIGVLWCAGELVTAAIPGLGVSPLALGLGLLAGLFGVIDPVALRRRLSWRGLS